MLKALIVDREIDPWFSMGAVLRQLEVKTNIVSNFNAAKEWLDADKPEMVFLDNHLDSGFATNFVRYIKSKFPATKIVVVKNHETAADDKGTESPQSDFSLCKPLSTETLRKVLEQLIAT